MFELVLQNCLDADEKCKVLNSHQRWHNCRWDIFVVLLRLHIQLEVLVFVEGAGDTCSTKVHVRPVIEERWDPLKIGVLKFTTFQIAFVLAVLLNLESITHAAHQ